MQVAGIIAEYNPLHLGHQFHMEQTRSLTGADYIITVLSGDYVQRGLPAILDKHTRARIALEAGSDLVLELPTPYALSSGEGFAFGGVSLLHGLGCVNSLSFGSEEGDLAPLQALAEVLTTESEAYGIAYGAALRQGLTHPEARLQALREAHPGLDTGLLERGSNNLLALEYCKALHRLESSVQPVTIKRQGQAYLDASAADSGIYASATAIREALTSGTSAHIPEQVPVHVSDTLQSALEDHRLIHPDHFSSLLHYKLLSLPAHSLTDFWEVTPDFARKITKHLASFRSFTDFANLLWTKDTTYARVCRTLMHILLDIRKDTWDVHSPVPYARVLGFRKDSAPLLSAIKAHSEIPLVTKLADADRILSEKAGKLLQLDITAAHIYDSVVQSKSGHKAAHEMQKQIVIL